jgi:putative ABC transport system permease protein
MIKASHKDIWRSIKKGWKRFLSIIIITALGVGMMTGIYAACQDMYYSADQFFDKQNLFDVRILSTLGLTQDDVDALAQVDGVEAAEGGYIEVVQTDMNDARKSVDLTVLDLEKINVPQLLAGALPKEAGEIAVTQKYLDDSGKSIGSTLVVEENSQESVSVIADTGGTEVQLLEDDEFETDISLEVENDANTLLNTTFTITGVVLDPKDIQGIDDSDSSFRFTVTSDYTFFITDDNVSSDIFTVVYLVLSGTKEMNTFSDEYETKVQAVISDIESYLKNQRERERYDAVISQAQQEITDANQIMKEKFAAAEEKFAAAKLELVTAKEELIAGELMLISEQKKAQEQFAAAHETLNTSTGELKQAEQELLKGEKRLKQGKTELLAAENKLVFAKNQLREFEKQLIAGEQQLAEAETQIELSLQQLVEAREQLSQERENTLEQLATAEQQLNLAQSQLDAAYMQLETEIAQLKSILGAEWPNHEWQALIDAATVLAAAGASDQAIADGTATESMVFISVLQGQIATLKNNLSQQMSQKEADLVYLNTQIEALEQQLQIAYRNLTDAQNTLNEKQAAATAAQDIWEQEKEALAALTEGTPEYLTQQAVVDEAYSVVVAADNAVSEAQAVWQTANITVNNLTADYHDRTLAATELDAVIEQLELQIGQLENFPTTAAVQAALGMGKINGGQQNLNEQKNMFATQKALALQQLAEAEAELAAGEARLNEVREELEAQKAELAAARNMLNIEQAKVAAGEAELTEGWREWEKGQLELVTGRAELERGKAEIAGARELLAKEEALAKVKIEDSWAELTAGKEELAVGEAEFNKQQQQYAEKKQEAQQKIDDAYTELKDIKMTQWYVQDRSSLDSYSSLKSDLSSIEGIGKIFPLIFLLVAVLMSLTTMTRMVDEERSLIGIYKALGFADGYIYQKYLVFALAACLFGGLVGDIFGFVFMPHFLATLLETLYSFPQYYLRFDVLYGVGGVLLFIVAIVGATALACRNELIRMPATLLRPKAPRPGARIWLEHLPKIWKRLRFLDKVTVRNLFRYKRRLFMTIGGIMGCMVLIVCGFAIKDSVANLTPEQYDHIYQYDLITVFEEDDNDKLVYQLANDDNVEDYLNLRIDSIKLFNLQGESSPVQLMVIPDGKSLADYIRLENVDGTLATLDDGVVVTQNATRILNLAIGDTVTLQNLGLEQNESAVAGIVRNYLGNNVYMNQETYELLFNDYEPNAVLAHLSDTCTDQSAYAEMLLDKESVISAVSVDTLRDGFRFDLINAVVLLLIVMAGGLAFVVLFTLANTNISERIRELATLKVLGFYDKEVYQYVNKETMIMTVIGILLGLPLGGIVSGFIMSALNMPSIHFAVYIEPTSYLLAGGITFCFAIIVNFLTNRSLDRIDMVEALKSIE